jgi:outer membrane lipoprotein SlyB
MIDAPQLRTITRSYETFEDARNVVVRLVDAGIDPDRIGLLGQQASGEDNTAVGIGAGAATGAATGLVLGIGALAVPGIGPIFAAGWFLSGAAAGALAGGVLGAMIDAGHPQQEAENLAAEHGRGRSVLSVRAEGPEIARAAAIMDAGMPVGREGLSAEPTRPPQSTPDDLSKAVS